MFSMALALIKILNWGNAGLRETPIGVSSSIRLGWVEAFYLHRQTRCKYTSADQPLELGSFG
jgi:hypothetical protein